MKSDSNKALRVGQALQARIRCTPFDFNLSMSTKSTPTSQLTPTNLQSSLDRACDGYFVRLQGSTIKVPKSLFEQMPTKIRNSLLHSSGNGLSPGEPIKILGPTPLQFRYFLHAFKEYPSLDTKKLSLDQLFSVSELACQFGLCELKHWAIQGVAAVINGPDSPLRNASNHIFIRALRLAVTHRHVGLSTSIQVKWVTRLHWKELSPLPAILIADQFELRILLGHAYYTHMNDIGDVVEYCRHQSDLSPLNIRQRTHLLAGFHSLSTYWKSLRMSPPEFTQSTHCKSHEQCLVAWRMRWTMACSRPCSIPEIDIFHRLRYVGDILEEDGLLQACLFPGCRTSALGSISKKRTDISHNLHHHFDLA